MDGIIHDGCESLYEDMPAHVLHFIMSLVTGTFTVPRLLETIPA